MVLLFFLGYNKSENFKFTNFSVNIKPLLLKLGNFSIFENFRYERRLSQFCASFFKKRFPCRTADLAIVQELR